MNVARLGTVVRTELSHQLRRPLFVILLLITFLAVWGLSSGNVTIESGASQVGGQKAWVTSEFAVSQTSSTTPRTSTAWRTCGADWMRHAGTTRNGSTPSRGRS